VVSLSAGASRLAAGELDQRILVESEDELGQLAHVFNDMAEQLQSLYDSLEERVAERTRELERRARYLYATADVARSAASTLDLHSLLNRVVHLVTEQFGFYHTGLFLLDEMREYAVLRAANSTGGQHMLARGHRLPVGQLGIVGYVTGSGEPRIALDVGADAVYFDNPDLPDTRSEMALPLRARGEIIGALDVQSTEPNAFSQEDVAVLQALADQIALAISTARLFQQAQESLEAERRAYGELAHTAWQELLRRRPDLGVLRNKRGVFPAGGEWPPEMMAALNTGQPVKRENGTRALSIPIKVRGQTIGVIDVHKAPESGSWTDEELSVMQAISEQVSLAVESARLYEDTQRRAAREQLIGHVTARVRESLDMQAVLEAAAHEVRQALGLHSLMITLTDALDDGHSDELA
jgi:GAF domain-containing protein